MHNSDINYTTHTDLYKPNVKSIQYVQKRDLSILFSIKQTLFSVPSNEMASPKQEYIVTEATQADFEGVLDINRNVYEGLDYLPGMYHEFLHNPNCKIYLVKRKRNGEIVSSIFVKYCTAPPF